MKHSPDIFAKPHEADHQSYIDQCNPNLQDNYDEYQDYSNFTVGPLFIADDAPMRPRDQDLNREMMFNQEASRNVPQGNQVMNTYEPNFDNIKSTPKQSNQQLINKADAEQMHGYFSGTNQASKQKSILLES